MRLIYAIPFLIAVPAFACMSSPEDNFKNWDKNNDGVVAWEEYSAPTIAIYKNDKDKNLAPIKERFEEIDNNKDGQIDKNEGLKLSSFNKC